MGRIISVILLGMLIAAFMLLPAPSIAADHEWRMVVGYPRDVALGTFYPDFAKSVETLSAGRMKVTVVYDGEGINQQQTFGAIKSGLVQMGLPYLALFTGDFPAGMIELGLPGGPSDYLSLQTLFHTTKWRDTLNDAYAKQGLYLLGEEYQLATYLLTKDPINSLKDLEGKPIRAPGAYGKMFRNLGASPVTMAYSEVYTGLATGVIWGVDGMNIVDHEGGKFQEIAHYLYPLPVSGTQVFPILVNLAAWNQLPDDLKAILQAAADQHTNRVATGLKQMETNALETMKKSGLKMGPAPSPEDREAWLQAGQKTWSEYANDETARNLIEIQQEFMKRAH